MPHIGKQLSFRRTNQGASVCNNSARKPIFWQSQMSQSLAIRAFAKVGAKFGGFFIQSKTRPVIKHLLSITLPNRHQPRLSESARFTQLPRRRRLSQTWADGRETRQVARQIRIGGRAGRTAVHARKTITRQVYYTVILLGVSFTFKQRDVFAISHQHGALFGPFSLSL